MRVLLDTQVWIWMRGAPARLTDQTRRTLRDGGNELLLSAATPWEIAVKVSLGKLRVPGTVEEFIDAS